MGKRKRKNAQTMYSYLSQIKTPSKSYFSLNQQHMPTMTVARIDVLENDIIARGLTPKINEPALINYLDLVTITEKNSQIISW